MSLINNYLSALGKKPDGLTSSNWADYLELLCLANIDGELSEEDVIKRLKLRLKDLKEGSKNEILIENELESDLGSNASNRARISDQWETKLKDWFGILSMRQITYGDFYPFKIDRGEIILKAKRLSKKQKLYVYLLLCSNLYLFPKSDSNQLSNSFEILSFETFKNILPSDAKVYLFGKNPLNKRGPFKGSLSFWTKVNNLASILNESLSPRMNELDYPPTNTGDGGLDIVAWIPTPDNLSSKIIFMAQCACGEWTKKIHESSDADWDSRIDFTTSTINNIFIPYCFRQSNGNWQRAADIKKAFLLDRKRILDYSCKKKIIDHKNIPSFNIVDEIFKAKEPVI